jgi:4-hydroxybenzoate polyprenyltransferase
MTESINTRPLCVDLDGTLMLSDTTFECLLRAIKRMPWVVIFIPFWLRHGIAYCKMRLANLASIDISLLPWNMEVVDYVKAVKATGRPIWLVTGSYIDYAEQVAAHWPLFDAVLATDQHTNLTGRNKAQVLIERCGERGFDYIGNEFKDRHIWLHAHEALVVDVQEKLQKRLPMINFSQVFALPTRSFKTVAKALRLHQWVKNLLIFIPLLTAHSLLNIDALLTSSIAFLVFGITASATYLLNDLLDLDSDRKHPKKSHRPFAAGKLSIRSGLMLMTGLALLALLLTCLLPAKFALALLTYLACTLAYSFKLKQVPSLDVIILACLYTLRVVAGAWAIDVNISFWLLAFSMFLFLCLAIIKRISELINLEERNKTQAEGRGYATSDRFILQNLGTASGYNAVMVLAFYINSPEVRPLYQHPAYLWLLCPAFLYWITRIWVYTARGLMNEDPIVFAIKDRNSWLIGAFCMSIMMLAA